MIDCVLVQQRFTPASLEGLIHLQLVLHRCFMEDSWSCSLAGDQIPRTRLSKCTVGGTGTEYNWTRNDKRPLQIPTQINQQRIPLIGMNEKDNQYNRGS